MVHLWWVCALGFKFGSFLCDLAWIINCGFSEFWSDLMWLGVFECILRKEFGFVNVKSYIGDSSDLVDYLVVGFVN